MSLLPLTSIKESNPVLFEQMSNIRELISVTGCAAEVTSSANHTSEILELLHSPQNIQGEFYKYYFDSPTAMYDSAGNYNHEAVNNPAGNNILLLAVARSAFNKVDRDIVVRPLVQAILKDALTKLGAESIEFLEFISFKFIPVIDPTAYPTDEYYYDNTPLTLSIKTGLIDVAMELVQYGANVNLTSYGDIDSTKPNHGAYTPLHLALLRLPLLSAKDNAKEIELIKALLQAGVNIEQVDNFSRSAKSIANLHNLQAQDKQCFSFKHQITAENCGMGGKDATGCILAFSFNDFMRNGLFHSFYNSEVSEPFESLFQDNKIEQAIAEFRLNMKNHLNSGRYIQETSKFCSPDLRQVLYDASLEEKNSLSKNFEILESIDFKNQELLHPHNEFHATATHLLVCDILKVVPCLGGDNCLYSETS